MLYLNEFLETLKAEVKALEDNEIAKQQQEAVLAKSGIVLKPALYEDYLKSIPQSRYLVRLKSLINYIELNKDLIKSFEEIRNQFSEKFIDYEAMTAAQYAEQYPSEVGNDGIKPGGPSM